jgi:hypothetical protein
MDEKTFEDIICRYPELIEAGLSYKGRQVVVREKRLDVLFGDRHGQTLIVELKKGTVRREDVGQLLDYEGYFVSLDDPNVRVMLVGNRVPENLRRSMDNHGFEWREYTIGFLITFLREKCAFDLLGRFTSEELLALDTREDKPYSTATAKRSSNKRAPFAVCASDSLGVNPSGVAAEQAVALIRQDYLEYPSFCLVRREAEAKAKEMLDSTLGEMSPKDIRYFLGHMNTESIKDKVGSLTRFGRHFTNIIADKICGCPHEFNHWVGRLWRTEGDNLQDALAAFLTTAPIKGAGTLLPTFVLYLRKPAAFNIWTENLEANFAVAFSYCQPPGKNKYERYEHFNRQVIDLLITPCRLAPQEVDLVLSHLPKYYRDLSTEHKRAIDK